MPSRQTTDPAAASAAISARPLPLWKVWLPSLIILCAAVVLALWTERVERAERRSAFEQQAQEARAEIVDAMRDYEALLRGGVGLLSVSPELTRAQWLDYVGQLRSTRLGQGARGIAYSEHVPAGRLQEFLRGAARRGLPGFAIRPPGERAEYCPVLMVAPDDQRNRSVSGYDHYSSPERRAAAEQARDTGRPTLTARLILAGEGPSDPQPGFLLFVPAYRPELPTGSVEERRAALRGFVSSPFRAADLLRGVAGRQLATIGLTVHDGEPDPRDPARTLLFSSPLAGGAEHSLRLEAELAGRRWTLDFTGRRPPGAWPAPPPALGILLLGLLLAAAVLLIVRNIDRTRDRAEALARQLTAELRQSESYNRAVFLNSSLPIGVGGADGRIQDANHAFLELLGYSREELLALSWLDITHPDDRELNSRLTREAREGRRDSYQLEKRYLRKGGQPVWVQLNVNLVRDAEGRPQLFIGTAKDISAAREMHRAEGRRQVLRTALLRLHGMQQAPRRELLDLALEQVLLLAESPVGYLYEYDEATRRFRLHSWSAQAQRAAPDSGTEYGLDGAGLWGEAVRQRRPILLNDAAALDAAKCGLPEGHAPLTRFLTVPVFCAGRVCAVVGVANKAEPYDEEDIAQLQQFTEGLWGILERQAAEQELREVTERFHLAVRAGRIALWDWDLVKGVVHCDPFMEQLFGLGDSNRTGTPEDWLCRVHAEDRERVRQALAAAAEQGGRFEAAFRVPRPGGGVAYIEASAVAHLDPQGRTQRLVGVNIDATRLREAEQRLARNHEFLQTVIDTLPNNFFFTDAEGRFLMTNKAFASLLELPASAVLGRTLAELDRTQGLAVHQEQDRLLLAGSGGLAQYEVGFLDLQGRQRLHLVSKTLVPLPDRDAPGIMGTSIDITDRKAVEEALREERRRLADVIEGTNAGTWEWNIKTEEFRFDGRWASILGYAEQELLPLTMERWRWLVHPEDLPGNAEEYARHVGGELPYYNRESRMRRKDGSWVWVHSRGRVFRRSEDGAPLLMSGTMSDISERKRAEEQVALVARFPVENPHPVLRADAEGVLVYANPAAAPLLQDWGQTADGALPGELTEELRLALESNRPRTSERSYASGVYSITVTPFVDKGYANIYCVDVTQRKTAELALRQAKARAEAATRAKAQFLANMSHEIRTPLAGVMGATRLLLQAGLGEAERPLAEMAAESARVLLDVVNDVLDFSKIEAGQMRLKPAPFALRRFVQGVAGPYGLLAREHGLRLTVDVAPDLPDALVGDEGRLGQVLRNLLSNALKFTEAGGVTLAVRREPGAGSGVRLLFSVSDTGVGIEADYLPRIFDSFSQADSSYAKSHGGTGLGLAICKNLVEQMGGSIRAESVLGRGSTFSVRLELPEEAAAPAAAPKQSPQAQAPAQAEGAEPLRVLLADDNAIGRVLMEHVLRKAGHEVLGVAGGQEVLDALRRERFDLVLMDVQMPGMDGLTATRAIRQGAAGAENAGIAIVALTAYAGAEDRLNFLAAGMDEAVAKPAEEAPLFAAMQRALGAAAGRFEPDAGLPPGQAEDSRAAPPPRFDQDYIRRCFGAEPQLLAVMLEQLDRQTLPELRLGLSRAQEAGDLEEGKVQAHKARGALGSVGAGLAQDLAARAEKAADAGDPARFAELCRALLEELAALAAHLEQGRTWGQA